MKSKILLLVIIVCSLAGFELKAQSLIVETHSGDIISEKLDSIRNLTFSNHNLKITKSNKLTTSFNLLTIKKLYFDSTTGIEESLFKEINLAIYPNPASNFIIIDKAPLETTDIYIFSIQSTKVMCSEVSLSSNTINVSKLAKGLYFLKINNKTLKFIKL